MAKANHIESINKAAAKIDVKKLAATPITPDTIIDLLKKIKGILIPALTLAKIFTNTATDVVIDKIIAVLNGLPAAKP